MIILKHFQSEKKRGKQKEEIGKEGECARANEGDKEKEEGAQGKSASQLPIFKLFQIAQNFEIQACLNVKMVMSLYTEKKVL